MTALLRPPDERVTCAALRRDGRALAVAFADGIVEAGPLDPRPAVRPLRGLEAGAELLVFSASGDELLGAAGSQAVVWSLESGQVVHRLPHSRRVVGAAVLGRGRIATLAGAGELRLWEGEPDGEEPPHRLPPVSPPLDRCVAAPGGGLLLTRGFDWCRLGPDDRRSRFVSPEGFDDRGLIHAVGRVVPAEGGRWVLIYWDDGSLYEAHSGRCVDRFVRTAAPGDVALAGDGQTVAVGSVYGRLLVHGLDGGVRIDREVTPDEIVRVGLSNSGERVVFVDLNGGFGVLEVASGTVALSHTQLMEIREPPIGGLASG